MKVELKMKSQLFYAAHQLVEAGPKKAVSWFAVGCYYHLLSKNDLAQRYFLKVCHACCSMTGMYLVPVHSEAPHFRSYVPPTQKVALKQKVENAAR